MESRKIVASVKDVVIILGLIGTLYAGYSYVKERGSKEKEIETLIFDDQEQKFETVQHAEEFKESLKVKQQFEAHVDDLTHEVVQLARELKAQRKQDSILRMRDAITNYQNKQNTDTLKIYWDNWYKQEAAKKLQESVKTKGIN